VYRMQLQSKNITTITVTAAKSVETLECQAPDFIFFSK
jgi:hypothetical protein